MKDYRRILLGMVGANLVSALIVFSYFAYIDLETYRANKAFWRGSDADWTAFIVVMALLSVLAWLVVALYTRPLRTWEMRLVGGVLETNLPEKIKRRAAVLPIFAAGVSFTFALVAGAFFAQGGLMYFTTDLGTFWRTFMGIGLIGGATSAVLVFLITDGIWRDHLPIFFPEGNVRQLNVPRVSVGMRLGVTFLLTGLVPLLILGVAARNSTLSTLEGTLTLGEILDRLQLTVIFIVVIGLFSNVFLSVLTVRSLLRPLRNVGVAMGQVSKGDLKVRVTVEVNDELGDIGSDFNSMLAELEQSQRMRDLFGRYVSKEIADQVLSDGGGELGGKQVHATALFSDIRDFTGLAERMPASQVVELLNRYYTRMVDVVVAEGGIVNKFGGDSLLALFGVPIRQSDHALRAVRAAWQMNRALAEFNAEQISLGLPALSIGVGISSGDMIAGNVGGEARREYTVIGDPVNLASRLQSLTKELNTPVLLSEYTQQELGEAAVQVRERERLTVRGKSEPTLVYELSGVTGAAD